MNWLTTANCLDFQGIRQYAGAILEKKLKINVKKTQIFSSIYTKTAKVNSSTLFSPSLSASQVNTPDRAQKCLKILLLNCKCIKGSTHTPTR